MRTIKELLQLVLDNKALFTTGLCRLANTLADRDIITESEYEVLNNYIQNNRPQYKWYHDLYNPDDVQKFSGYYWRSYKLAPRVKWLKEHINKN